MALLQLIQLAKKFLDIIERLKDAGTLDAVLVLARKLIDIAIEIKASGELDNLTAILGAIVIELEKPEVQEALNALHDAGLL